MRRCPACLAFIRLFIVDHKHCRKGEQCVTTSSRRSSSSYETKYLNMWVSDFLPECPAKLASLCGYSVLKPSSSNTTVTKGMTYSKVLYGISLKCRQIGMYTLTVLCASLLYCIVFKPYGFRFFFVKPVNTSSRF